MLDRRTMNPIKPKKGKFYWIIPNNKTEKVLVKCTGRVIGPLVGFVDAEGNTYFSTDVEIVGNGYGFAK
jgi:hypothetical protein